MHRRGKAHNTFAGAMRIARLALFFWLGMVVVAGIWWVILHHQSAADKRAEGIFDRVEGLVHTNATALTNYVYGFIQILGNDTSGDALVSTMRTAAALPNSTQPHAVAIYNLHDGTAEYYEIGAEHATQVHTAEEDEIVAAGVPLSNDSFTLTDWRPPLRCVFPELVIATSTPNGCTDPARVILIYKQKSLETERLYAFEFRDPLWLRGLYEEDVPPNFFVIDAADYYLWNSQNMAAMQERIRGFPSSFAANYGALAAQISSTRGEAKLTVADTPIYIRTIEPTTPPPGETIQGKSAFFGQLPRVHQFIIVGYRDVDIKNQK